MTKRKYPVGAELRDNGVDFRIWAPKCHQIDLAIEGFGRFQLEKERDGYFSLFVKGAKEGMTYYFNLNGQSEKMPDPISRFQPNGPHGPSCLVDPHFYEWKNPIPQFLSLKGQILYEIHIGTFTKEGTWRAAQEKLVLLKELGITLIEMMPVADFVGDFGWGYDGVNLFAPTHLYGTPDDLRAFIDEANRLGMGVILDVVYNHFGPSGNYISHFSEDFFSEKHTTDWGKAINFDSPGVREFFITNALYWIEEYHFSGLRMDATQNIYDSSDPHILAEMASKIQVRKKVFLFAENEDQKIHHIKPQKEGGYGLDASWNDDFHHTSIVRLIGKKEAYYSDYFGSSQEFVSVAKYGYLYQGQYYSWQKKLRGQPALNIGYNRLVHYLENHDQIANFLFGMRLSEETNPSILRIMTLLLLLLPQVPLLFQGQEFGSTTPFYYFADQESSELVLEGRKKFLSQFPSHKNEIQFYKDPGDRKTYLSCKLNWEEKNEKLLLFHKDLIRVRKEDPTFFSPNFVDGAVMNDDVFLLRFFGKDGDDRLVLFNFGIDYLLKPMPEPLFAPPKGKEWILQLTSQNPIYGGLGTPQKESEEHWVLPGQGALIYTSKEKLL